MSMNALVSRCRLQIVQVCISGLLQKSSDVDAPFKRKHWYRNLCDGRRRQKCRFIGEISCCSTWLTYYEILLLDWDHLHCHYGLYL